MRLWLLIERSVLFQGSTEGDSQSEKEHGGQSRYSNEPEEKLYGVAIQFQKDPNNVLRVFNYKKGGPAWYAESVCSASDALIDFR